MSPQVEIVTKPVTLGEGPHWDSREQALYFVSILDKSLHKYVPATGAYSSSKLDTVASFIIPIEGKPNRFVAGMSRQVVEIEWDGSENGAKVVRTVAEVDRENPGNKLNDGKVDPRGRLFAGTLGKEMGLGKFELKKGSIYRIDPDGSTHHLDSGIDLSNGLCWDVKEKAFYFIDSFEYTIRRYDYDVETGHISNRTTVLKSSDHGLPGILDGMTIDTDGHLWVANFGGSQMLKVDPRSGKILQKLSIPALQVTSATFGGAALDELFVTTGALNHGEGEQLPPCGATFRVTGLGVSGHQNVNFKLNK